MPNQSELQNNLIKLEDCCSFNPRANKDSLSKECSFIPMSAVSENGLVDLSNSLSAQDPKKGFSYFENGDVLFAKITPCMENGKGAIVDNLLNGFGFGSTEFHVIRANSNVILPEWVYFLTKSDNFRKKAESAMTGSAGQKRVPLTFLKNYRISLPSLQEQKNNSKILFKIQKIQMHLENLLNILDLSIKSRFVEMFHKKQSIKSVNLEEVCSSIVRGPFGSALKKDIFVDKDEQSIKIYEQKHAIRKDCNIGSYYISKDTFEELKRFKCGPGDILMSCSGTIGELYQLPEEAEVGIINQALCKFTPKKEINSEYFLAEMNHIIGHVGTQGSSIKNIVAVSQIKKLQFLLPTDKRQTEYACFVKQVNKSKFAIQKSIEKLEILKKSLMQEYFG